ncbi:hypothetical protein [Micromonospora sp. NPDC005324]
MSDCLHDLHRLPADGYLDVVENVHRGNALGGSWEGGTNHPFHS